MAAVNVESPGREATPVSWAAPRTVRRRIRRAPWFWTGLAVLITVVWIAPIAYMYLAGFASQARITAGRILPAPPFSLDGWRTLVFDWDVITRLQNSFIVAGLTTALAAVLGLPAAYGLSRFKVPGKRSLFLDLLSLQAVPPVVAIVALFLLARRVGLLDTYGVLVLVNLAFQLPFVLLVMKSFFDDIPSELDEAARLDGSTWFRILWAIVLPVSAAGVATVLLFVFVFTWNEYLFASILVGHDRSTLPVMAALTLNQRGVNWDAAASASVIVTLPVLLIAVFLSRRVARGLSFGAIKS